MPPSSARARSAAANDRGMQVLELKLSILISGPGQRRNPALDVLTGRVPDERLVTLQAGISATRSEAEPAGPRAPSAMVLPVAAVKMAAVARAKQSAPSPWLQSTTTAQPRLRLVTPPEPRWMRIPVLNVVIRWFMAEFRPYTSRERTPRAHLAS